MKISPLLRSSSIPPPIQLIAHLLAALLVVACEVALGQTPDQGLEASFRAGQAALRQGDFARAVEDFKRVLVLDPGLVEAEVNLGLAYQGLLDYAAAARDLSHALKSRPDLPGVNVIVGMDYIKLGTPERAAPYLKHALELNATSPDAHEAMALYHLTQENFQGAAEQYRKVADLDPDKPEALFKLGHQYLDLAARLAYRGARLYPDSPWGHRFLGDTLFERDRWEEAAQEYKKALAIDSRQPGLHTLLGEAYLHTGNMDGAEAEFRQELQLDARDEKALLGMANLKVSRGRASEALASVEAVWQSSPEFLKAHPELFVIEGKQENAERCVEQLREMPNGAAKHFLLSALYAAMNRNADAESESKLFQGELTKKLQGAQATSQNHADANACKLHRYSQCIAMLQAAKPATSLTSLALGRIYFGLQQYERAAEALARVHGEKSAGSEASYWQERAYQSLGAETYAQLEESFPDSWRNHQLRAEGYALRRDRDNAIKEYEAALQLRPNEAELHESLGEFYLDDRSDAEAQKELEKAASLDASRTKTLYLLGRLYVTNNETEKAIPFLRRALQLQPNLNEASGMLGTAYVRLGQFADAIPRLEKAASLDHYGNVHYQMYQAYRKLGQSELAQKALARSQEIRRSSLEHDQAVIMGAPQTDAESQ